MATLHDRMPVVLPEAAWATWLGEASATSEELANLLVPYPANDLAAWPVDKRVGNVRNDDPSLFDPVAA
jgi:putative SOS response-associated peptidase YedK